MNPWIAVGIVLAIAGGSFAVGHSSGESSVQSKWDKQKLEQAEARDKQLSDALGDAAHARAETEAIRQNYIEYKAGKERETTDLENAVAAGSKRLSVRATCPASVQRAGTSASGTASATVELDADARQDYYAYRRAYSEQFATLNLCRDELIKRSAK